MAAKKAGYYAGVADRMKRDDPFADKLRRHEEQAMGWDMPSRTEPVTQALHGGMDAVKQHPWQATKATGKAAYNVATGNTQVQKKVQAVRDDPFADRLRRHEEHAMGFDAGIAPIEGAISGGMDAVKQHPWQATKATGKAAWQGTKAAGQAAYDYHRGYTDGKKGY